METLIKIILMSCIVVGGLHLMGLYAPTLAATRAFMLAGYSVTWGLLVALVLFYAGIKAIN